MPNTKQTASDIENSLTLRVKTSGDEPSWKLASSPKETPSSGQVSVRLSYAGLNRADLLFSQNRYFIKPGKNSRLGFEGVGVVEKCGPQTSLKPGDRVAICPMSVQPERQGCLASHAIFDESQLLPNPDTLNDAQCAAFWMAYLTAWGGLFDAGRLDPDQRQAEQTVLITAASSSVGIAAMQLAKAKDCKVIATGTQESKFDQIKSLGADLVIKQAKEPHDYERFETEILEATEGKGLDLSFDAVAGPAIRCLLKCARKQGNIVVHGRLDRRPMDIHAGVLMKRQAHIHGFTLDQTLENPEKRQRAIEQLTLAANTGQLSPCIAKEFELADFESAFAYLASNQQLGKVLVNTGANRYTS